MDSETRGNATLAYCGAYGLDPVKNYNSAKASASSLLTNLNIKKYCRDLLNDFILCDLEVDIELVSIIKQNENLPTKLGGIREYNRVKKRVISEDKGFEKDPLGEKLRKIMATYDDE